MKKIAGKYRLVLKSGGAAPIVEFKEIGGLLRAVVGKTSGKDYIIEDVGYVPLDNVKFITAAEVTIDETVTKDLKRLEEIQDIAKTHGPVVLFEGNDEEEEGE